MEVLLSLVDRETAILTYLHIQKLIVAHRYTNTSWRDPEVLWSGKRFAPSSSSVITSFITLYNWKAPKMSDTGFDGQGITPGTELILSLPAPLPPASLFTPTPKAARRVLEFFTARINNPHTRRAYLSAARRFDAWCEARGIAQLTDVQAFHVAAFIKDLQGEFSPPTVKQHLAALRMLFDWLVTGHVLEVNPAHAVRGPKYVVRKGKTPVLTAEEARELLESIETVRTTGIQTRIGNHTFRATGITAYLKNSGTLETAQHNKAQTRNGRGTVPCRPARSRPDRRDGLHLRPRQRRAEDESPRLLRAGAPGLGAAARERGQGA